MNGEPEGFLRLLRDALFHTGVGQLFTICVVGIAICVPLVLLTH